MSPYVNTDSSPINRRHDLCPFGELNVLQRPALKFFKAGAVHNVADVFLTTRSVGIDVLAHIVVSIQNDLDDAFLVCPLDEVLAHAGILLAGSAQQGQAVILLLTASPCTVGTVDDTLAAADALLGISDGTEVLECQCAHRLRLAFLNAGSTADTAVRLKLGLGHTHNAEIVHSDLVAVIGAASQGNLEVQIVGEYGLLDPLGKSGGIVTSIRTDPVADAGRDISGACSGIAAIFCFLIDFQTFDDTLEGCIDSIHLVEGNAGDLKALTTGDVNGAVAVFFGNVLKNSQVLRFQMTAGNADTGCSQTSLLGDSESIFL